MSDFILPEKWCVRGTNDPNSSYRDRYRDLWNNFTKNTNYAFLNDKYYSLNSYNSGNYHYGIPQGYVEITLEQFEKYVVNKSTFNEFYPIF